MRPDDDPLQILDELRLALLRGDLAALEPLAVRLDQSCIDLSRHPASPDSLHEIGRRASETMELLAAAGRGVLAAKRRLVEIATVRQGLVTYGGTGQRQVLDPPGSALRRV